MCSWSKWEWFVIDLELRDMEDRMQTRHVVGKLEPIRLGTYSFDDLVRSITSWPGVKVTSRR